MKIKDICLLVVLLSLIIGGSIKPIEQSIVEAKENVVNADMLTENILSTISVKKLNEISKFSFHLVNGEKEYDAYVFALDEKNEPSDTSWAGANEGDIIYTGNYQIALSEFKDDKTTNESLANIQTHLPVYNGKSEFPQTFNDERKVAYKVGKDSFVLLQHETSSVNSGAVFYLKDGKLEYAKPKGLEGQDYFLSLTGGYIKNNEQDIFQSVDYDNVEMGWFFNTWKLNRDKNELQLIDQTIYNDQIRSSGWEIGKYYYEEWTGKENFFFNYKDLDLTKQFLEEGKKGYLHSVGIGIGVDEKVVIEKLGEPSDKGGYEGGMYYYYEKYGIVINSENNKVNSITISGERIKKTMKEVKEILGEPSEKGFNEIYGEPYYRYHLGEYDLVLHFNKDEETSLVSDIWIRQQANMSKIIN